MTKSKTIKEYTLANGDTRYMFKLYAGVNPLTGKELHTTRRGFKTKKEANVALAALKADIHNGTYKKKADETYQDFYDMWIGPYEDSIRDSTFLKTERIFKNHILPLMSNYRIDKIDIATCQELVNHWSKELKGFKMVKSYAARVITFAITRGYIQTNPFDAVEMPIFKKKDFLVEKKENFYSREQLLELIYCFKEEGNLKHYAFFHLLAFSGMRKGEAFALTWKDINFKTCEINIVKAVARGKKGLYVGPVKNGVPRTIVIEAKTLELLQEWKELQSKEILQLSGNKMTQKQFVFPTSKKNGIPEPNKTHPWLKSILDKYHLEPLTTHGFRHTHCSLLFEAGASIKEVQYRLGHEDVKTTLEVYAHVTKKTKSNTAEKFSNYLLKG